MSQGFGIDVYGIPFYGYSQPVNYSVAPFTATEADYGEIVLSWAAPSNVPWKYMELVRSTYGYPSSATDGVLLQQFTNGTMQKTYDDAGLTPGTIYYYAMFITLEAPTWNSTTNYILNTQVLYNGIYWTSLSNTNLNNTPAAGSSFWASSAYVPTWLPAGYAATLALANDGYGTLLYNRAPTPYKTTTSDVFGNTAIDNQSLQNYLNVMGFGLDQMKNFYDSLLEVNNPDVVSATSLDYLGQQLGINTDYMSTPQQRRQRIKNATVDYQMKGEAQSIHNLIAQLTGWNSTITEAANQMNNPDQSAFYHPSYDTWNVNTTYFPNQLIQYNGYNYKNLVQSVGSAQAPTGANSSNTWWQVQVQQVDTTTLLNPKTGGYSTWGNLSLNGTGFTVTVNGVETGLASPTNSAIHNWNALSMTSSQSGGASSWNIFNYAKLNTPNYSSSTNYVINNEVLYTDGYYYTALKPSGPGTPYGAQTPGQANSFWKAFYYTTSDQPNLVPDSVPNPIIATWNANTQYEAGVEIQYFGIKYLALLPSLNQQPTGNYYSNTYWACLGGLTETQVISGYINRISSNLANSVTMYIYPAYYDNTGRQVNNYSSFYSSSSQPTTRAVIANFPYDYKDLNLTLAEPLLANAYSSGTILNGWYTFGGGPGTSGWTSSTSNLWESSYGMAWVNQTTSGTTEYSVLALNTGMLEGRYCVTFASDYNDTAHYTHGLVFAYNTTNTSSNSPVNFYYATRQSLWFVNSSGETKLASWTRLNTGDRMVVDLQTNSCQVYKYARDGKGTLTQLANVSTTPSISAGNQLSGLIQKYSSTGAL